MAGALKTLKAIEGYLEENSVDAIIVPRWQYGLCSFEPIVEVHFAGEKAGGLQKRNIR